MGGSPFEVSKNEGPGVMMTEYVQLELPFSPTEPEDFSNRLVRIMAEVWAERERQENQNPGMHLEDFHAKSSLGWEHEVVYLEEVKKALLAEGKPLSWLSIFDHKFASAMSALEYGFTGEAEKRMIESITILARWLEDVRLRKNQAR